MKIFFKKITKFVKKMNIILLISYREAFHFTFFLKQFEIDFN
jgi:hypothetical protein